MYFHAVRKKYHQFESEFTGVIPACRSTRCRAG